MSPRDTSSANAEDRSRQELIDRLLAVRRHPDPKEYGRALARERHRFRFGDTTES